MRFRFTLTKALFFRGVRPKENKAEGEFSVFLLGVCLKIFEDNIYEAHKHFEEKEKDKENRDTLQTPPSNSTILKNMLEKTESGVFFI